jgi:hypothetical protein
MTRLLRWSAPLLLVAATAGAEDPPARVGRVSYLDGAVSFRSASVEQWAPASLNRPLTTGDRLWTDKASRGEVQLGGTSIRLGPETAFAFLNLDDHVTQMQVTQGAVRIHVRQIQEGDSFEIATPSAALSLVRPGTYRVDVDAHGDAIISVQHGGASATADGSEVVVNEREAGVFTGGHPPIYDIQDLAEDDDWDRWCEEREARDDRPRASARYVPEDMVGAYDLDTYGHWRDVPGYGPVWVPSEVAAGWAPYRAGHWAYVAPWGWTWIDDEPWGFAPFHYGRWVYVDGGWGWVPGRLAARPVYAPALVAFVGGTGWHASLALGAGGGVAWFPLGPREVYYPPYAVSRTYVTNVNVTHVTVNNYGGPTGTYVNQSVSGAVTAVPQTTFASAQPVAPAAVSVPPSAVKAAPPVAGPSGVQPTTQNILAHPGPGTAAGVVVPQPPATVQSRPVVAKLSPPPPPTAFSTPADSKVAATNTLVKPAIPAGGAAPLAPMKPARASLAQAHPVVTATTNTATTSTASSKPVLNDRPPTASSSALAKTSTTTSSATGNHQVQSGEGEKHKKNDKNDKNGKHAAKDKDEKKEKNKKHDKD